MNLVPISARTLAIIVLAAALMVAPTIGSAQPRDSGIVLSIDVPSEGEVLKIGDIWTVGGWAVDPTAVSGTGIVRVDVAIDGPPGAGGATLGQAKYGASRPDVASMMQRPNLAASGFNYDWTAPGMVPGGHVLFVQALSASGATVVRTVGVVMQGTKLNCSMTQPCFRRGENGWWLDDGGPFIRFEMDQDQN